jgi:hypothetical protein
MCLESHGELLRYFVECLTLNTLDITFDFFFSRWILQTFCRASYCELSWYVVGCFLVNFLAILTDVSPSIISIFIWTFRSKCSQHSLRRFSNEISRQFYPGTCRWIFSTFCLSSIGKFFSIFCKASRSGFPRYVGGRHLLNYYNILLRVTG